MLQPGDEQLMDGFVKGTLFFQEVFCHGRILTVAEVQESWVSLWATAHAGEIARKAWN